MMSRYVSNYEDVSNLAQRSIHFELDEGGYFGLVPVSSARGSSHISYSVAGRKTMHNVLPKDQT